MTLSFQHDGKYFHLTFNDDFTGDVSISLPIDRVTVLDSDASRVTIPCEAFLGVVAQHVRNQRHKAISEMTPKELLESIPVVASGRSEEVDAFKRRMAVSIQKASRDLAAQTGSENPMSQGFQYACDQFVKYLEEEA